MNLPTYEQIKPYIEKKLISENEHPENPAVRIFNYTQSCQFSRSWDEVTMQCRGLIMNVETGEVLARPFPKFFNYQEHIAAGREIPAEEPVITDKMDGSLGILYHLNGYDRIATRGSFTSDQAEWATRWWHENVGHTFIEPKNTGRTLLFEIIYPANRIVVNYDFSGLVFLGAIYNDTGKPAPARVPEACRLVEVRHTPAPDFLKELAAMDAANSEGFVIHFQSADLRLKIKFPEYVRLHKVMTGLSEIGIWEGLATGKRAAEQEGIPDELFKWIVSVEQRLIEQFITIQRSAESAMEAARMKDTRKEQAQEILSQTKYPGIAFAMLDGKKWEQQIWQMLRPKGKTTFKVDIDG